MSATVDWVPSSPEWTSSILLVILIKDFMTKFLSAYLQEPPADSSSVSVDVSPQR